MTRNDVPQKPGPTPPADDVERGVHEHYRDAVLYDYEYRRRRRDVNFYRRVADGIADELGHPCHILELACGSGRITRGLVVGGHSVVGLDLSQTMLARARQRLQNVGKKAQKRAHLVRADMRRFAFGRRFHLVVMGFNSFEHLYTRVDVAACLSCVREHLEPGGRMAFDVQNPDLRWLCRDPKRRWARTRFRHPDTSQALVYSTNHTYDPVSQIAVIRLYYESACGEGPTNTVTLSQRKFFPAELEMLLHCSGFRIHGRYGDFSDEPLAGDAESQVLVCAPRTPTA